MHTSALSTGRARRVIGILAGAMALLATASCATTENIASYPCPFVGAVRDHDENKSVTGLEYSAHPTALDQLADVAEEVAREFDVLAVAAVHRVGELAIGDAAVVVATAAAHRGEAFEASRALIDRSVSSIRVVSFSLPSFAFLCAPFASFAPLR